MTDKKINPDAIAFCGMLEGLTQAILDARGRDANNWRNDIITAYAAAVARAEAAEARVAEVVDWHIVEDGGLWQSYSIIPFTHWQPLPAPPGGEEGNQDG